MRILATADIHGVTEVYEWIPEVIADNDVDALILACDFLPLAAGRKNN
jgi:Icc-related predicted phosphoesterase